MPNFTNRENPRASTFPIMPLEARTETEASAYIDNPGPYKGVRLYIEVDDSADTPSVVFSIQFRGGYASSTDFHTVLSSAAVTGAGRAMMEVYPGGAAAANLRATYHVGRGFRVNAVHGDADSITYSVHGEWLN